MRRQGLKPGWDTWSQAFGEKRVLRKVQNDDAEDDKADVNLSLSSVTLSSEVVSGSFRLNELERLYSEVSISLRSLWSEEELDSKCSFDSLTASVEIKFFADRVVTAGIKEKEAMELKMVRPENSGLCSACFCLQRFPRFAVKILREAMFQNKEKTIAAIPLLIRKVFEDKNLLLDFLASCLFAVSENTLGIGTLWHVLVEIGKLGAESHERLPDLICQVSQLLEVSKLENLTTQRFLVEAWLVPKLIAQGRTEDADILSSEGLEAETIEEIIENRVERQRISKLNEFCKIISFSGREMNILKDFFLAAVNFCPHQTPSAPVEDESRRIAVKLQQEHCYEPNEGFLLLMSDFRAPESSRTGLDLIESVCERTASMKELVGRVEEALAREALLKNEDAAALARKEELETLAKELQAFSGEASLASSFLGTLVDIVKEVDGELHNINNNHVLEYVFFEDKTILEPRKCIYEFDEYNGIISIDNGEEAFSVSSIKDVRMGAYRTLFGLQLIASLPWCFFLVMQSGMTVQLVSAKATLWVDRLQSSLIADKRSLEYSK